MWPAYRLATKERVKWEETGKHLASGGEIISSLSLSLPQHEPASGGRNNHCGNYIIITIDGNGGGDDDVALSGTLGLASSCCREPKQASQRQQQQLEVQSADRRRPDGHTCTDRLTHTLAPSHIHHTFVAASVAPAAAALQLASALQSADCRRLQSSSPH